MAIIRIRRSATAGNAPTGLLTGEIAVNEADGILFYRTSTGASGVLTSPQVPLTYTNQTAAQMAGRTMLVTGTASGAVTITLSNTAANGITILFLNPGPNTLTLQWGLGPSFPTAVIGSGKMALAAKIATNVWSAIVS